MLGASSALEDVRRCLTTCSERSKGRIVNIEDDATLFCELFTALLAVLRFGLRHGESFLRFFQAAAKEIPPTPEIHDVLARVFASGDTTIASMPIVEREAVYLLASLQAPGSLMRTAQRCFRVTAVMHEYYDPDVPFFSEAFLAEELQPALMKLARLKLKAPSIEEGLRALHLHALAPSNVDERSLSDGPHQAAEPLEPLPVVASHEQQPSPTSDAPMTDQVAGGRGSSSVLSDFGRAMAPKPLSAVPVVVKKKRRSKLSTESSTQTIEDDPSLYRTRHRSVAVMAQPSTREIVVQTTIVGSIASAAVNAPGAFLDSDRSALEAWESALAARERSLTAKAFELQDRERILVEREQLLFSVEASMSPQRSSRAYSLAQHASPAGRNGRCLSSAIRAAVQDADHQRQVMATSQPGSPLGDNTARHRRSEGSPEVRSPLSKGIATPAAIEHTAAMASTASTKGKASATTTGSPAPSSPEKARVRQPQALLASALEWVDVAGSFVSVVAVDTVAEQQGFCCAACSIPVQKEEIDVSSSCCLSSSTPTPQESARATPRIVSRVISSATELKNQLESRLTRVSSQRSSQSAPRGEGDTPQSPPSASSSGDVTVVAETIPSVHASGYRYCYYSGNVFCKTCLPDSARFPIPAKIVTSWDFTHYPVNVEALCLLQKHVTAPTLLGAALDPLLNVDGAPMPKLKAARGLRRQLRILHTIVGSCPDASHSPEIARIIASRYVALDEPYSIRDLIELEGAVLPALQSPSGALVSSIGLLDKLKKMRDTLVIHCVKQCESCKRQSAKPCGLCSDRKPLFLFDTQNTNVCGACGGVFHCECWRMAESQCPRCGP